MIEKILTELKKLMEEKNNKKESFEGHIEEFHKEDGLIFTLLKNESNRIIYIAYSLSDSSFDPFYKRLEEIKEKKARVRVYFFPQIPSKDTNYVYNAFSEIDILEEKKHDK